MYNDYFGFKEAPFSIAPDPRYLYMSEQHREAFAHLLYGIQSDGGFVLFTGEVGTGKTTICRCLLEQLPEECEVAFIFNPPLSAEELLSSICDEFRIPYPPAATSNKTFVDRINRYLLEAHAAGRKTVLIIDEAQNLSAAVLEQMRLLTNLETNQRKLLQIILLGQPELQTLLARPELRQLRQRIVARCHLESLSKPDVAAYVQHRLGVAGCRRQLFPASTLGRLYRLSDGIPRLINVLCDRALLGVYAQGNETVDIATLAKAAREVFGQSQWNSRRVWGVAGNVLAGLALLGAGAFLASAYYYKPQAVGLVAKTSKGVAADKASNVQKYRKRIVPEVDKLMPKSQAPKPESSTVRAEAPPGTAPPVQAKASTVAPAGERQAPTGSAPAPAPDTAAAATKTAPQLQTAPKAKLQWPADASVADSEKQAYEALFKQWGGTYQPQSAATACQQAADQGLACLSDQGRLADLRRINRPALLKLVAGNGQVFYATLIALDGEAATLAVGGKIERVASSDLAAQWHGDYTLLWRMPPHYQGAFQIGAQGPTVEWFLAQLSKLQGRAPTPTGATAFDAALAAEVERFQVAQGLKDDGIVGPQTLIRLNNEIGRQGPRLTNKKKDG